MSNLHELFTSLVPRSYPRSITSRKILQYMAGRNCESNVHKELCDLPRYWPADVEAISQKIIDSMQNVLVGQTAR